MKRLHTVAWVLVLTTQATFADPGLFDETARLEERGRSKAATALLNRALAQTGMTADERHRLAFERDRLERIRKDFPLTKDALFAALRRSVKDLRDDEFEGWLAEGRFDSREFDGGSDAVDFQRGELESGNQNIYFDKFSYELDLQEVK